MGNYIEIDGAQVWRAEAEGEPRGGLIVNHEIWGLVGHARDVANRFAAEGYVVYAPDLLSEIGTTPEIGEELQAIIGDPDEQRRIDNQPRLREAFSTPRNPQFAARAVKHLKAVVDALEQEPGVDGRIGVVGFCFGGSFAFALAAHDTRIKASIPFYGSPPTPEEMPQIHCPVLAVYGQEDEHLIEELPEVEQQMRDAGVDLTVKVYDNAGHAFFNDQNQRQYEPNAAAAAWELSLAFLAEHL